MSIVDEHHVYEDSNLLSFVISHCPGDPTSHDIFSTIKFLTYHFNRNRLHRCRSTKAGSPVLLIFRVLLLTLRYSAIASFVNLMKLLPFRPPYWQCHSRLYPPTGGWSPGKTRGGETDFTGFLRYHHGRFLILELGIWAGEDGNDVG